MGANGNALIPIPPAGPAVGGQEFVTVSRRPPDIEDYIDIVRRYRGWLLGPAYAGLVIAVVVAFLWEDTYVSSAVMRITPPQVPERLVPTTTNLQMSDRLNTMRQDILSRTSVSAMIQSPALDLYREERAHKPMEDLIAKMQRSVSIDLLDISTNSDRRGASAFRISFAYNDRYKAQAVVRELVTKFTEQNAQALRSQSTLTTSFLGDEMNAAKADVDRLSAEVAQFRISNAGRLPEQMQANFQRMNALQMQMYTVNEQISRASQDKLLLETNLQNLKNQAGFLSTSLEESTQEAKNERLEQLRRSILEMETGISAMLENYTERHPDIRAVKAKVEVLKRERDALERQHAAQTSTPDPKRVNVQVARSLESLKSEMATTQTRIRSLDLEMQDRTRQLSDLQRHLAQVQALIETAPSNEQRYAQLLQDMNLAKQRYEDMNRKKAMSDTANNLEERKAGENLEVLDPASLPEEPTEPDRLMMALMGLGGGLAFGVVMAGAKEMKDTSLKNLKDVRAYTNLPVLTSIPLLENALLLRRKRRLHWLAWTTATIVGIMAMSAAIYYYYFGRT